MRRPGLLVFSFFTAAFILTLPQPTASAGSGPESFTARLEYADKLAADADFYQAMVLYKELLYFYPVESRQSGIDERLCRVYLRAGEFSRLKDHINANRLTDCRFRLLSGLGLFLEGDPELSERNLEACAAAGFSNQRKCLAELVRSANLAQLGRLQEADALLATVPDTDPAVLEVKVGLKKGIDGYAKMRRKDPGLAVGLSIVPGVGLMYAGNWIEGSATLAAGGLSLYAGYQNFHDRDWLNFSLWSAAFLYFYVRNFISAREKAEKYNEKMDSFLKDRLENNYYFKGLIDRYASKDASTDAPSSFSLSISRGF